jgi:ketosteroid isomerase-like protein
VSRAGDLGWTFGACEATVAGETTKGAYTRVWQRDDSGRWLVAVDIFNPERQ